jgi:7 transmembrane receptor (rhodopsin family)
MPIEDETDMKKNFIYQVVYENLLYCLFVFLGPLVIIAALNACLVHALVRARRRRRSQPEPDPLRPGRGSLMSRGRSTSNGGSGGVCIGASCSTTSGEQNLTLVMVVIVLIFVICQTPACVNQVLYSFIGDDDYNCGKVSRTHKSRYK